MKLAWCMLALVLASTDNLAPAQSPPVSSAWCVNSETVEVWPLRVREALRMGLENSTSVRVTFAGDRNDFFSPNCFGAATEVEDREKRPRPKFANRTSIVVESVDADARIARTKSEAMATVRSVEQGYWNLAAAHAGLWAADRAVQFAENVVEVEQADEELALGIDPDQLAVAIKRLKQFQKELVARTSDVVKAERQLRQLMGAPESDKRRFIPVNPPVQAPLVFAWGTYLESVLTKRPDVLERKDLCHRHRENLVEALRAFDEALPRRETPIEDELSILLGVLTSASASRETSYGAGSCCDRPYNVLEGQVKYRRESHETPHAVAQAMLEADRTYQCYANSSRLRIAGQEQIEAQRLTWGNGRTTTNRYLDAVEQYATLVANEHHRLAVYNSALAVVSECKGTLLDDRNIIVADSPPVAGTSPASPSR